jgi:hypothetical protein
MFTNIIATLVISPGNKLVELAVFELHARGIVCTRYLPLQFTMEEKNDGTNTNQFNLPTTRTFKSNG